MMLTPQPSTAKPATPARPFTGFLDEFSRPANPWLRISTYGVVDGDTPMENVRELYERYGVVKVRGAFGQPAATRLLALIRDFSGLHDVDFPKVASRKAKPVYGGTPTLVDRRFWPLILQPNVVKAVRRCFDPGQAVTEIGTAIGAHYSARGLHRDFHNWYHPTQGAYNLTNDPNSVFRVLIYVNGEGRPAGSFGFVPFTHKKALFDHEAKRIGLRRPFEWFDTHREVVRKALATGDTREADEMDRLCMWVHLDPGDGILLDGRILHGGDFILGPRYFMVMSFVKEDEKAMHQLRARWRSPVSQTEVEYFSFLHANGFCSARLLAECRRAMQGNAAQ